MYHVIGNNYADRIFTTDPTVVENALSSGAYFSSDVLAYVYSNTTGWNVPNAVPPYGLDNVPETDHYLTTSWSEVESAVSSDGVEHQVSIASLAFDSQISYVAVPRVEPVVHLYVRLVRHA